MQRAKPPTETILVKAPAAQILKQYKKGHLGYIENRKMRRLGKRDGKRNLPKQNIDGTWISPVLQAELDANRKFVAHVWRISQRDLASDHREVERLCVEIERQEARLTELRKQKPADPSDAELSARKAGESHLPAEIVRVRRQTDFKKRNAEVLGQIKQHEAQIVADKEKLDAKRCEIKEAENSARLVTGWILHHAALRADSYWNGILQSNKEADKLPVVPALFTDLDTDDLYTIQHQSTQDNVIQIIKRYQQLYKFVNYDCKSTETEAQDDVF